MNCHNCRWRDDPARLPRCLACPSAKDRDGEPFHVGRNAAVYLDAHEGFADAIEERRRDPSPRVTPLPPDAEDALRGVLAAFAGLDPVDALLAHHLLAGRSLATFRDAWRGAAEAFLRSERKASSSPSRARAFAWARAKRLVAALGEFRAVVPGGGAARGGGGGRPKRRAEYTQEEFL